MNDGAVLIVTIAGSINTRVDEAEKKRKREKERKNSGDSLKSWRPRHVTVALAGLGPVDGPMVDLCPAEGARQECNAASAPSSRDSSGGPCASRGADGDPENPATRSSPPKFNHGDTRRSRQSKPA